MPDRIKFAIACWKAFRKIVKHKIAVFRAGHGWVPMWRLIVHDFSKLTWTEFKYYTLKFELQDCPKEVEEAGWAHHLAHNDHHLEFWPTCPSGFSLMPKDAIKEMVADWMGASYAYEGKWPSCFTWEWGKQNIPRYCAAFDVESRMFLLDVLWANTLISTDDYTKWRFGGQIPPEGASIWRKPSKSK